jgi:hypothetical protein
MQQKADVIRETNPGMKASNGWLHGMGLPIEYVGVFFEHIPQIISFVMTLLPLIPVIFIIRCRLCPKPTTDVKGANQVLNQISNQLSNQTSNQILN